MANLNTMVLTLDLDGKKIKEEIESKVRKEIIEELKKEIKESLYKTSYYNSYSYTCKQPLNAWVIEYVKEIISENKQEIIDQAARQLASSLRRSKPVRDKFCNILGEELRAEINDEEIE